jgi:hypothetical protein
MLGYRVTRRRRDTMPHPFTDAGVASAEEEFDVEFDDADLEAMIEVEPLIDDVSFDGLEAVY